MRVNCNISAIMANNQLQKSETALDKAIERLSSGYRINNAEDDAAGMAISNTMRAQIKALDQVDRNATDGISVIQTAEGALGEMENMIQRARELSVQAADQAYSDEDRQSIQNEIDQIMKEVDRISSSTEYNTMSLLDGTNCRKAYSDANGVKVWSMSSSVVTGEFGFSITTQATQASMTLNTFNNAVTAAQEGTIEINGAVVAIQEGQTYSEVYENIMGACNKAGVTISNGLTLTNINYGTYEELNVNFSSTATAALFGMGQLENSVAGTDAVVSLSGDFSATSSVTSEGCVVTVKDINNFEMKFEVPGNTTYTDALIKVTDMGTLDIQVGTGEGQRIALDIPEVSVHTLGLDNLNVKTSVNASKSITKLDKAVSQISSVRAKLGAYQNRLETTNESLASYTQNITSALSALEDCDMAEEMTNYTAQNVISQAATSILSQANERPQTVLQMLQ